MSNVKTKCNTCKHNYKANGDEPRCNRMCKNYNEYEPMTNYDKIKAMSIEEMADWLYVNCEYLSAEYGACSGANDYLHLLEFLESEVEE